MTFSINQSSGEVKAVICDGSRNNQAFCRLLDTEPQQPWLTKGGIYSLYDFCFDFCTFVEKHKE